MKNFYKYLTIISSLFLLAINFLSANTYYGIRYAETYIEVDHLDPIYSDDSFRWLRFSELVNARLVTNNTKFQPIPDLIDRIPKYNEVESNFHFKIREYSNSGKIKWKDKTFISTDDIEFSLKLYKESERKDYLDIVNLLDIEKINDTEFLLKKNDSAALSDFKNAVNFYLPNLFILPKHLIKDSPLDKFGKFTKKPIGAGPFYIESIQLDGEKKSISLNKNIYYHGQKEYTEARSVKKIDMVTDPEIGNVIKNLIKDKDSCIDSDGNNTCIDILVEEIDSKKLKDDLSQKDHIQSYPYAENSWMGIAFNTRKPLLEDKNFRIIFDMIIDDQKIIDKYYNRGGRENMAKDLTGPFNPDFGIYAQNTYDRFSAICTDEKSIDKYTCEQNGGKWEFDYQSVINLLVDGGFQIKEVEGEKYLQVFDFEKAVWKDLEFTLLYNKIDVPEGSYTRQAVNKIIKYFKKCKINIKEDPASTYAIFKNKLNDTEKWDLVFKEYIFDWKTNIAPLFQYDSSSNITGYYNPILEQLLKDYNTDVVRVRREKGQEIHRHCWENVPYLFLWTVKAKTYYREIVDNITVTPMTFFGTVTDWKIEPRKNEEK